MLSQNDYPAIKSLKEGQFPYKILEKVERSPDLIKHLIDNELVKIEQYKRGWFRKRKVLDISFVKIEDADCVTKSFDSDSDGRVFGFVVIENGNEIYRALFDLGLLIRFNKGMKELYHEKGVEYLISNNLEMAKMMNEQLDINGRLTETANLIEKLFQ